MFTVAIMLGFTTAGWVRLFCAPRPNPDPQMGTPIFHSIIGFRNQRHYKTRF